MDSVLPLDASTGSDAHAGARGVTAGASAAAGVPGVAAGGVSSREASRTAAGPADDPEASPRASGGTSEGEPVISPRPDQTPGAMSPVASRPAWKNRLSTRIVTTSVVALILVLGMVFGTLWLSWQLEGAAAAINETGSLRMRANRIGLHLLQRQQALVALQQASNGSPSPSFAAVAGPDARPATGAPQPADGHAPPPLPATPSGGPPPPAGARAPDAPQTQAAFWQAAQAATLDVRHDLQQQGRILGRFAEGVPGRPFFLSTDSAVRQQFQTVTERWQAMSKLAQQALRDGDVRAYLNQLDGFVDEADRLVRMLETGNARNTTRLRGSQSVLIVMACLGTLAVVFLLYRWIIRPVQSLHDAIRRMAERDFSVRVPVTNTDELGVMAQGFNHMAGQLQSLYEDLGEHVRQKTAELERQNQQLSALYGMTAFLNKPNDIEALCRGFLERAMDEFHAAAATIRVLDPSGERLHIVVSLGFSSALEESEHCMRTDACFCGEATQQGTMVIHDFRKLPRPEEIGCMRDGFQGVSVFQIVTPKATLGTFSLHFRERTSMTEREVQLLEMMGQHLGVALDNLRLGAKARQLAVAEERNLVAQGLHDSLAQGLNFLNLQTQMLGGAVQHRRWEEVEEIVPLLKTGVSESYQDVRELLQNFRTRLAEGSLRKAVDDTIDRFRRQTGTGVELLVDDRNGAPLHPEQQLQILFILQEALSNVRKHAQATHVTVRIDNHRDFIMLISDNGRGYDPQEVASRTAPHVGLSIMRERAARLGGKLDMCSAPGKGTEVSLMLAHEDRLVS